LKLLPSPRVALLAACLFAWVPALPGRAQTSVSAPQPASTSARITGWPSAAHDNMIFAHVLTNEFEGRASGSGAVFRWDGEGWIGSDMNRLWVKSEGFSNHGTVSDGDHEFLYDHPIPHMRYFDAQAGVRADIDSAPTRVWAAFGMEGLAPFGFDFEPTFYISNGGHLAGRIEGSYDLYLTQRWVLQPQAELNFYSKDDPKRDIGSGFSDIDAGIRLHYQISRKFTPYVGWTYAGKYGDSARYTRQAGESVDSSSFVFGLRLWY
jgi:copper resistance protein B